MLQVWFTLGSDQAQCSKFTGSMLVVQRCVHMLHICGSDGVLGLLLAQIVELWVPFETDVVPFGFRCVSILVRLRFRVCFSLAWVLTWSMFGACVLQTRFSCCSDLDLIGFIFDQT